MKKLYPINSSSIFLKIQHLFLLVCFMLVASASFGQTTIPFNSSGTFTVPCGVTSITVKVWGAGGGGHNTYNYGGGGGAFAQSTLGVSSGNTYIVTVGSGAGSGTGNNGEDSSFGSLVIAKGGNGGNGGSNPGRGGQATVSPGVTSFSGGNGGTSSSSRGAGGGAAAGTTNNGSNGGNANSITTGSGGIGTNGGGSGGNGGTSGNGEDGFFPGGGGGERSESGVNSGSGGNGKIEVIYSSAFPTYCSPTFTTRVEPITNVTFAGINNTTTNTLGGPSLEIFCDIGTVVQGFATNPISIKGNTDGAYLDYVRAYIDWDQNGVFGNNLDEIYNIGNINNSTGIDAITLTGNIAVPATAALGSTRMRVIKRYSGYSTSACQTDSGYGQAEDYTVNVTSPCPTYVINSVSATNACMSGTSTAIISSTSTGLPIGNYTVTYNRSSPSATGLTATMTVSTAGTGSFSVTGLTTAGSSTITVTKLTLGTCETTFTGKTANLTVNANNIAAVVFGSPNGCVGTAITAVTHTTTGATGIGLATGLPTGVIASFTPNTITISGTPTASGIYDYSIPLTGGCGTVNATGTIIVSAAVTPPTIGIGTISQPTCTTATGSVVLNGLPPEWELTQTDYLGDTKKTTGTGTSTPVSGLSPGTYTYSVVDTRKGLKGEYFNNANFTGAPVLTRIDPRVDFDWVDGSFDTSLNIVDDFSVRWSGQLLAPTTDTYTFRTDSDDGIRLWVNGVQVINNWTIHPRTTNRSAGITLTAGVKYNIVLEFYERGGQAVSQLFYSRTGSPTEVFIPQSQLFPSAICGSLASANVIIDAQPAKPTIAAISTPVALCSGGSLNLTAPTVTVNGSAISSQGWQMSTTSGGSTYAALTVPYTVAFGDNGKIIRYTASNGCGTTTSNIIVLTVNDKPTIAAISTPAALCSGGSLNPTAPTVTANSSTITASGWQLETGFGSGSFSNLTVPYTVTFADNGKKTRYYVTNSCGTTHSNQVVVTVADVLAAPIVGTITHPYCTIVTGTVELSGLPTTGTWTLYQDGTPIVVAGTGPKYTVTGISPGDHYYTVNNGTCTSVNSSRVGINATPVISTTAWKNVGLGILGWSNGVPSVNKKIVFEELYNSISDLTVPLGTISGEIPACSCEVTDNVNVTIASGHTLKVVNEVRVLGAGKLTFENNSSLVQVNNPDPTNIATQNSGNIIYKRNIAGIKTKDYIYWSSPVSDQLIKNISPTTSSPYFYSFNADGNNWQAVGSLSTTKMSVGKGYIIRGPESYTLPEVAGTVRTSFEGVPNNGDLTIAIGKKDSFNLIGNPYPSALDASQFLATNNGVLGGTIYFWTHNTAIQSRLGILLTAGSGDQAYTSDDYAAFNITGGVATFEAKSDATPLDLFDHIPSGKIAAGQSFFATSVVTGGSAIFKNSMRIGGGLLGLDNSQFFKIKSNSKESSSIEKSRVWLNLTNTVGAFKQTLIGYITGATNDYESSYDGVSFNANKYINFYSVQNGRNYMIQGRALPFDDNDVVPLGYKTTIAGAFKIAIEQTDGLLSNKKIYLEDKLLGKVQDLSEASYSFTTEIGTFDDRFALSYTNKTLATDDFEVLENQVVITSKNKEININASTNYIDKVFVYDVTGKQIFLKSKIDKNEFTISNLGSTNHVLVVKVLLQDNSIVTKKIIF